jgi:hypothetical protein
VTTADPVFVGVCHCTKCQKSTGSAYGTVIAFPTPSLTVTGTTKQFDDVGDSGQPTHRTFCPNCGSTITQFADVMQGLTMVAYGTLDDPSIAKPTMQIYCDSALPWSKIPEVQGFPKMPG